MSLTLVKEEPGYAATDRERLIKEPSWDSEALAALYTDHEVKDKLIRESDRGGESSRVDQAQLSRRTSPEDEHSPADTKEEGFGATAPAGPYNDHVVKDVPGPQRVQSLGSEPQCSEGKSSVDGAFPSRNRASVGAEMAALRQVAFMECCVRLERIPHCGATRARGSGHEKLGFTRDCRVLLERCAVPIGAPENLQIMNTYACDVCSETFTQKHNLIKHMKHHLREKGKNTRKIKKQASYIHARKSHRRNSYACDICRKTFVSSWNLKKHLIIHTRTYSCNFCIEKFSNFSSFNEHKRSHKVDKPFSCTVCKKSFGRLDHLEGHKRLHTGEKPFSCDVCKKSFTLWTTLKSHKLVHSDLKPYTCDICKKNFKYSCALTTHRRVHTGEKPFACVICKKRFAQSGDLAKHKRTHTGEKPHSCEICKKLFSKVGSLKLHQLLHTGERPYACDICEKKFSRQTHLSVHKRFHTGEKPYACDVCQKRFTQSSNLKTHKLTHTGARPFPCDLCKKRFTQSSHLQVHKRVHSGETPYFCETCDKSFITLSTLKLHQRIHTGEKPYSCGICSTRYTTASNLQSHNSRIHAKRKT